MIDITNVLKITEKLWKKSAESYLFEDRLCRKHLKDYLKKHMDIDRKTRVIELLGICHKCHKPGIVYYLEL